ncbi:MAG: hypothetical protein LBC18_03115 [Opitutaceae bacterium]|nr:hypothetical protein [Opitutaceae bacterium]
MSKKTKHTASLVATCRHTTLECESSWISYRDAWRKAPNRTTGKLARQAAKEYTTALLTELHEVRRTDDTEALATVTTEAIAAVEDIWECKFRGPELRDACDALILLAHKPNDETAKLEDAADKARERWRKDRDERPSTKDAVGEDEDTSAFILLSTLNQMLETAEAGMDDESYPRVINLRHLARSALREVFEENYTSCLVRHVQDALARLVVNGPAELRRRKAERAEERRRKRIAKSEAKVALAANALLPKARA